MLPQLSKERTHGLEERARRSKNEVGRILLVECRVEQLSSIHSETWPWLFRTSTQPQDKQTNYTYQAYSIMELPFAVESPERTSQLLACSTADDGSSLVTTSSQGSFLGSSTGTGGFATHMQMQQHHPHHLNNNAMGMRPAVVPQQVAPIVAPLPPPRPPPPSSSSSRGGITSGLNIFGSLRVPSVLQSKPKATQAAPKQPQSTETIDFTYVNVCDVTDADEVDITLDGQHTAMEGLQGTLGEDNEALESKRRGDILTLLLSGAAQQEHNEDLVRQCEEANQASSQAMEAKREGDLQGALKAHSQAARQFRDAAILVKDRNEAMANSLLLLSQTQAKSALALKRIVKQQPIPNDDSSTSKNPRPKIITQKDRLRAAVRGALVTRNEEEMSDSAFLGKATKGPVTATAASPAIDTGARSNVPPVQPIAVPHNPVDDMMELERELRDMDMALELGNSIASLDARTQSRLKNSISGVDGSFMVVPPGSQSFMSSSSMWSPSSTNTSSNQRSNNNKQTAARGTAGVRQRANRVQNLAANPRSPSHGVPQHQQPAAKNSGPPAAAPGLESSWWGNSSTTSQVLASSVISLGASSMVRGPQEVAPAADPNTATSANTKQLMRLMDALKTLGDENANLLREVEEAEAARMEAKAAKEQMAKFKSDYAKRFENLKAALEKFRKGYPEHNPGGASNEPNPVTGSEFMRSASTTEQLQRQDQLIRKLTADLKKEKEESKKKDQALRKYESFYREVKARSAQKAAQRQREANMTGQRPPQPQGGTRRPGHR